MGEVKFFRPRFSQILFRSSIWSALLFFVCLLLKQKPWTNSLIICDLVSSAFESHIHHEIQIKSEQCRPKSRSNGNLIEFCYVFDRTEIEGKLTE